MQPKRISKFVASLAVCGFLLGVSAASAAPSDLSKSNGKDGKPSKPHIHQVGPIQDKQGFLASLAGDGSCESSCCYAWVSGCTQGSVSCSNTSCSFSCDGITGSYTCGAT